MINLQISFWDVSKTSLGHLSSQLDKMDQLTQSSSQLIHTFETAQKIYLNSCKKLVNISKDGLIEQSQNFIDKRKQYQLELDQTAISIRNTYDQIEQDKCYFSINLAHGLFTRSTFPYMPNYINKFCQKPKNQSKRIYQELLKYEQPKEHEINVTNQSVIISNNIYSVKLDYLDVFYFATFNPKQQQIISKLQPQVIQSYCQKFAEQLPELQKKESFLIYLCYYFNNFIKFAQAQVAFHTLRTQGKTVPILQYYDSQSDFENQLQSFITYKNVKKCAFSEIIIKSNENYYIQLSGQTDSLENVEIYWNINDNLEQKLANYNLLDTQKQNLGKILKLKNRAYPTYFKLNTQIDQYHNEDPSIDEIFKITKCQNYFKMFPFIIAQDSSLSQIDIWYEIESQLIKLPITYEDELILEKMFQYNEEPWEYLRWIIVRTSALKIKKSIAQIKLENKAIKLIQNFKKDDKKYISILNQDGFKCQDELIPLQNLLPSFNQIDFIQIKQIIEDKLIDAKFSQIQEKQNNQL
ncbi:unnamed protein product [Paramecium primaurelia]|uniref:Uncharacterized protein n=1 Tax=Paramecium primaurelia TaxID=5886 RepID=A0A8S1LGC9_PARPR|nr:unnamed protein product [Paramecium primaurelia]